MLKCIQLFLFQLAASHTKHIQTQKILSSEVYNPVIHNGYLVKQKQKHAIETYVLLIHCVFVHLFLDRQSELSIVTEKGYY